MQQNEYFLMENNPTRATDSEKVLIANQIVKLRLEGLTFKRRRAYNSRPDFFPYKAE